MGTGLEARCGSGGQEGGWVVWGDGRDGGGRVGGVPTRLFYSGSVCRQAVRAISSIS